MLPAMSDASSPAPTIKGCVCAPAGAAPNKTAASAAPRMCFANMTILPLKGEKILEAMPFAVSNLNTTHHRHRPARSVRVMTIVV